MQLQGGPQCPLQADRPHSGWVAQRPAQRRLGGSRCRDREERLCFSYLLGELKQGMDSSHAHRPHVTLEPRQLQRHRRRGSQLVSS